MENFLYFVPKCHKKFLSSKTHFKLPFLLQREKKLFFCFLHIKLEDLIQYYYKNEYKKIQKFEKVDFKMFALKMKKMDFSSSWVTKLKEIEPS